jgi:hypothetical protein
MERGATAEEHMSRNEQLNQQYEETINLVKSRAVWRVGEQLVEGETLRCSCFNCGYASLHQRFDITRHRLLFGKSIRAMEAPRPMLRCRRCGHQQHLRDIGELVVPSTIALHDNLRDTLRPHLRSAPASGLPSDVLEKLAEFREEASGPVRQLLLTSIADAAVSAEGVAILETVGRELFLDTDQIAAATGGQSTPSTD